MDENRDASTRDISRSDPGSPTDPPPTPAPTQHINQESVPPELRPTGSTYSTSGEPTRQWSTAPPPPRTHLPPARTQRLSPPHNRKCATVTGTMDGTDVCLFSARFC